MNAGSRSSLLLIGLAFLAPRLAHAQEAAEVTCKDGTTSHAGQGACSGHGGVDKTASATHSTSASSSASKSSASAASAAAPTAAAAAEVTCKDRTTDHAGKGACSGHGGVDKTASATHSASASASPSKSSASAASAAAPTAAAAAEVTCKDGTTSHGGKGACSGHGGVDKSASAAKSSTKASTAAAAPAAAPMATAAHEPAPTHAAAPTPAPTATAPATKTPAAAGQKGAPTAKCKDGSLSYAQHHSGACSDHGGVAQWLDGTQQ